MIRSVEEGPASVKTRRAKSPAQLRTKASLRSVRHCVGTAVVLRRPHAEVVSGASKTSLPEPVYHHARHEAAGPVFLVGQPLGEPRRW